MVTLTGIVTILSVSFAWEVIGISYFSMQTVSSLVPILSCTEIVVEAMGRVLVGGCTVVWGVEGTAPC